MEINCNKCENLLNKTEGCKVYGSDPVIAPLACAADQFKNYQPQETEKLTPGEEVWVVERDGGGIAYEVSGYVLLAEVAGAVIVTPYINDLEDLEDLLAYHIAETQDNYDTDLAVFPAEDCYVYRCEAEEVLARETEG